MSATAEESAELEASEEESDWSQGRSMNVVGREDPWFQSGPEEAPFTAWDLHWCSSVG